jgi:talin
VSQETQKTYKLTHIKRWAAADKSFTFDFGDYEPDYVTLYTPESEQIAQLISGYIEIILKTKRDAGKIVSDRV